MADPGVPGGAETDPTGIIESVTNGQTQGTSAIPGQRIGNGTDQDGESFFDYESIKGKPELEAAYKSMQSSWTKGKQQFAAGRDKISQYDNFMANPVETMKQLASQYGYQMVQGDVKSEDGKPQSFNNWEEVTEYMTKRAEDSLMAKMNPMLSEVQNMKKQNIETMLDNNYPDWRVYEDGMMDHLRSHPTLVNNPELLYQMSVPPEVLEARAYKKAMQKMKGTTDGAITQGHSSTTQQQVSKPKARNFEEAVQFAKQHLQSQGLSRPRE